MGDQRGDWIHVRVKCPNCGASVYVSWPPDDRGDHLVKHGKCRTFRIGRKEALQQQFANAVLKEQREKRERAGEIGIAERSVHMRSPRRGKTRYNWDRGDEEE